MELPNSKRKCSLLIFLSCHRRKEIIRQLSCISKMSQYIKCLWSCHFLLSFHVTSLWSTTFVPLTSAGRHLVWCKSSQATFFRLPHLQITDHDRCTFGVWTKTPISSQKWFMGTMKWWTCPIKSAENAWNPLIPYNSGQWLCAGWMRVKDSGPKEVCPK